MDSDIDLHTFLSILCRRTKTFIVLLYPSGVAKEFELWSGKYSGGIARLEAIKQLHKAWENACAR